jgi:sugar/nucleoside kinase (ribokinase family)
LLTRRFAVVFPAAFPTAKLFGFVAAGRCHAALKDTSNDEPVEYGRRLSAAEELRSLAPYADAVLGAGVKHIVVTLGANGAAVLTRSGSVVGAAGIDAYHVAAIPSRVVGLTGAGDSLVAGCVSGLLLGDDLGESLHRGVAAASVVIQSAENVPPTLTDAAVSATKRSRGTWLRL